MASAWEKRNAAARAKGYRNYYDYRLHRYGDRPASEAPARGEEAAQLRGQRGPRKLSTVLRKPSQIALITEVPLVDSKGQWPQMRYVVTFTDGNIREYVVDTPDEATIEAWRDAIYERDIEFMEYASQVVQVAAA